MNIKVMSLSLLTAGVVLTSCQSDPVYLDPDSMDGKVVTVEDINQQDWGNAADQLTNSLRMSGSIAPQKHKDHKNVVMVSRVRNETNEHIDIDLLMKKIRIGINRTGHAMVTTAVGVGGTTASAEDDASKGVRDNLRGDDEFKSSTIQRKGTMLAPDFSLSGKIIQSDVKSGRSYQTTFTFQMSLTDLTTGIAIWEDEVEIIKKGKKGIFGK